MDLFINLVVCEQRIECARKNYLMHLHDASH